MALAGDRAFLFYHCHAGRTTDGESSGLRTDPYEFKRSSLQVAELELRDGKIACDRDEYARGAPPFQQDPPSRSAPRRRLRSLVVGLKRDLLATPRT